MRTALRQAEAFGDADARLHDCLHVLAVVLLEQQKYPEADELAARQRQALLLRKMGRESAAQRIEREAGSAFVRR